MASGKRGWGWAPAVFRFSPKRSDSRLLSAFGQPVVAFGAALGLFVWISAVAFMYVDRHAHETRASRDAINLARIAQQNALGVLDKIDTRLRFFSWVEREQGGRTEWPALLADRVLAADDSVEVTVTDEAGIVVAASRENRTGRLADVSEQPYFVAERRAAGDELFVGPVAPSPDGAQRLYVSRARRDADGRISGVIAFSIRADFFNRELSGLDIAEGGGLALVGDDGLVRSGSGVYLDAIGKRYAREDGGFDATQRVGGYPLWVAAHLPPVEDDPAWRLRQAVVLFSAFGATVLTAIATVRVARRRRRVERELLALSRRDALTGLANRRALSEALDAICEEEDAAFALHVLDLDRFKSVNDTYGHLVGDELLQLAAGRLVALVGEDDLVARLGGDEFAILQRVSCFETDAPKLANRVNAAMANPFPIAGLLVSIGATVGVASGGVDGRSAVELMRAADLALYAAKGDGRGCARVFRPELTETALARVKLEAGLRAALEGREFHLVYQPIRSLIRDKVIGYEALLRWRPDGGDLVSPAEFIPLAEELGLIVDIGAWALRKACDEIATLDGDVQVSVNVAPAQLETGSFVAAVKEALAATALPARRLRIEITESSLLQDKAVVLGQIRQLREMGVGVSLDDFGTGYSCLSYLELYPIDTLKIDQRFVNKLGSRPEAVATLKAIVDLARSYGMKTVAEGVETKEQLAALRELGCDKAQGYWLGRPGPLPLAAEARAA